MADRFDASRRQAGAVRLRAGVLPILALTALAAGCDSGGIVTSVDGTFIARWSLAVTGSGEAITCTEAGTPWVALELEDLSHPGRVYSTTFSCARGVGASSAVSGMVFRPRLKLIDASGTAVDDQWADGVRLLGAGTPLPGATLRVQRLEASWSITRQGAPVACTDVGAVTVRLLAADDGGASVDASFPCETGRGLSQPIPNAQEGVEARYVLQAQLLDGNGAVLTSNPLVYEVPPDQRAVLPAVVFSLP
jgi:hypothetical protein